jgi:hypothetical protein
VIRTRRRPVGLPRPRTRKPAPESPTRRLLGPVAYGSDCAAYRRT